VWIVALAACALASPGAYAQHPIDVQRLSADGEHFKALTTFEIIPARRMTLEGRIAAARSAWALGLNERAAAEFDSILREPSIPLDSRARLTITRGAIEYQEERYQEAALYAEKGISVLKKPSALRGRGYLLWGQSLLRLKAYGTAEEKFLTALAEADESDKPEIHFALGTVEMKLGKYTQAEEHFQAVPTDHDRTPQAVRNLAAIALDTQQYDKAQFWLEKGKQEYPDAFLDSWADYGLVQVALSKSDLLTARQVAEQAAKQYPPSDPWLLLMQASLELSEWDRRAQLEVH
jgi:tetratricopeptide (TPR) repeat protein